MKLAEFEINGLKMYVVGNEFGILAKDSTPVVPVPPAPPEPEPTPIEYDVEVPKLSEISSLYNTQFSWRKVNNTKLLLESNVNFTYCSSDGSCPTQLQNLVCVKDLNKYKGFVVDLVMTYSEVLAYTQNNKYFLYGVAGMNYGIFQADINVNKQIANTNPKNQYYKNNTDKLFVRYVEPRQAGTSRLKIDIIRNNAIYASGSLVYTLPTGCTPLLGFGYGFSTSSGYEAMISPSNVVARNLSFIKAGHELLKETVTQAEVSQLLTLHNEAIQRGIPNEA